MPGKDQRSRRRDQPRADLAELPHDELARLILTLEEEMHEASADLRFEYAARLRDEIKDLKRELREVDLSPRRSAGRSRAGLRRRWNRSAPHAPSRATPSLRSAPCPSPSLTETPAPPLGWRRWLRRPVSAALILLVVYAGLSLLNDPHGSLGTDTGGKVATLVMMQRNGRPRPRRRLLGLGPGPDGTVHGLYNTTRIGDRYVNVTSLPMVLAADAALRRRWLPPGPAAADARVDRRRLRGPGHRPAGGAHGGVGRVLGDRPGLAAGHLRPRLLGAQHRRGPHGLGGGRALRRRRTSARPGGGAWPPAWRSAPPSACAPRPWPTGSPWSAWPASCCSSAAAQPGRGRAHRGRAGGRPGGAVPRQRRARDRRARQHVPVGPHERRRRRAAEASSPCGSRRRSSPSLSPVRVGRRRGLRARHRAGRRARLPGVVLVAAAGAHHLDRGRRARRVHLPLPVQQRPGLRPGLVATTPLAVAGVVLGWSRPRAKLFVAFALVPLPLVFFFQFPGGGAAPVGRPLHPDHRHDPGRGGRGLPAPARAVGAPVPARRSRWR